MKKDLVLQTFNSYVKSPEVFLASYEDSFKSLSLVNKCLLVELIVSYHFFKINHLSFHSNDCLNEIINISQNFINFVLNNENILVRMLDDLKFIISNKKKIRIKFDIGFTKLDPYIYLNILLRSIHFVSTVKHDETNFTQNSLLHRNLIISNIINYVKVFSFLNVKVNFKGNCIKLIILLTKYLIIKKEKNISKNKFASDIYIGFNFNINLFNSQRILLIYGLKPFQRFQNFMVCSSHLTLCDCFKKNLYQHHNNDINTDVLLLLASKPIQIDFTH